MTKQFAVAIILLSVLMVLPVISGLVDELEDELLKKGAGDSIDCGDGYIILIRNVNPKGGEVLMELQLDDRTIDDKILRKGEAYTVEKYNEGPFCYNVVDIYHDTTGDYVVLKGPYMYWILSAHLDLIISSVPQRADILIDEQYVGKTPKTIPVTNLEMHSLRLELSGYEDEERTFKFEPGDEKKELLISLSKIEPILIITPPEGTIEVYTFPSWSPEKSFAAIESATFTISGPATYSESGYWIQSNAPPGTYTITYGSASGYKSPLSETKTLSAGGSITFEGHYLLKKGAGDSFDFGDGYVLFIRKVDPERGEVSIELQLDNRTIDDKILRKKGEYYVPFKKYSQVELAISFNVEDIYHDTTGDYVDLWFPFPPAPAVPHSNLIIASVPQGADILIDGEYGGKTPKTITIADLEMHSLCLELSGYEDEERIFNFESYFGEEEMLITLNKIQPTPTPTPTSTPSTPTPIPTPTLIPHTPSPTPTPPTLTTTPTPTLIPHTPSPTPPTPTPVPHTPKPTRVPGFLTITFISAILCGYLILKKWHGN
uniref:PEGA domain-containing protein n=1 Tax=Candidatus Methanophagaceae archaeon ANME-1 ERB6 TaxID=2759912 RepID=A0A7G9YVE7_9EURY|nr:hypothetical protein NODOFMBO_00003 [Methanosarcinales archaeon ANME-1 ERB6]